MFCWLRAGNLGYMIDIKSNKFYNELFGCLCERKCFIQEKLIIKKSHTDRLRLGKKIGLNIIEMCPAIISPILFPTFF